MGRFHRHDADTVHEHGPGGEHLSGEGPGDGRMSRVQVPSLTADEHLSGEGPGDSPPRAGEADKSAQSTAGGEFSGYQTGARRIEVLEEIFGENDRLAAANRADFDAAGVRVVNLMSSPGAGKTLLLRQTLDQLQGRVRVGIIEGDIETSLDADRLEGFGAAIALINTGNGFGGECHLDAPMVRSVLPRLSLRELDLVVVENVGNLVCPAEFSVGEHVRAMVFAVTEGEEKPLKYPVMFRSVDLVIINKIDLLPYLEFDLDLFLDNLRAINPGVQTIMTSARTGEGVPAWCEWLLAAVRR